MTDLQDSFNSSYYETSNRTNSPISLQGEHNNTLFVESSTPSQVESNVEDNDLEVCNNYRKRFQTPIFDRSIVSISQGDENVASKLFESNSIISSTPIMNNTEFNFKTPEHKRKLFKRDSCLNSTCLSVNSDTNYEMVSSPSNSEFDKLNDSKFLNDSFSLLDKAIYWNDSTLIECDNEKTLHPNRDCSDSSGINVNSNSVVSNEICFHDSSHISLKSFDLLPGIRPLNDD